MRVPARKTMLGLCLAAGLVFAVTPALAVPSGGCVVGALTMCRFDYTGAPEAWVVPAGVTSGFFQVLGAQGGSFPGQVTDWPGGSGGLGGGVGATVALTPGATLNMRVGGKGDDGFFTFDFFTGTMTAAGGFNGGGTNTTTCTDCRTFLGGAGGGSSDVRTSADGLADRLLAAGGGGGAGIGAAFPANDPGDGGGSATAAKSVLATCSGGAAGTFVGPGAAGSGAQCTPGSPGALGGLNGGDGVSVGGVFMGAGGGGYFGGGAGAFSTGSCLCVLIASGGGGGSDFPNPLSPPAGISNLSVMDGVQSGNGFITVTYATPTAVALASASAARTAKGGVLVRWRTGTEAELLGFQVYRSRGHSWKRLTRSLIVAKGSVAGASYRFLDRTARRGVAYRYRIKAVNRDGTTAWFGPVRVT